MTERNTSANPEIAVLQTQMVDVQKSLGRIETKLDNLDGHYVTVKDFTDTKSELVGRVSKLENRNDVKNTLLWTGLVTSALVNIFMIYQMIQIARR